LKSRSETSRNLQIYKRKKMNVLLKKNNKKKFKKNFEVYLQNSSKNHQKATPTKKKNIMFIKKGSKKNFKVLPSKFF